MNQPGGKPSRYFLRQLALGKMVRVEAKDTNRYGRTVAEVFLPDGRSANAELVKAGHAWVYRHYCRHCLGLNLAEALARLRGLGLWAAPGPIPPWTWRKTHRSYQ